MLEEKQVSYRVSKVNMRSYGDKPAAFLAKVPSGLLPALELDGRLYTDSLPIMSLIEATFPARPMLPPPGSAAADRASALLRLERQLFGAWCDLTFRPSMMGRARSAFLAVLGKVEDALAESAAAGSSWLLGGPEPSVIDLQYVSHVERMCASVLFWKGLNIRNHKELPQLEAWLRAFERRPAYLATKSDYYTHVCDIPPQYGEGVEDNTAEAKAARAVIDGEGPHWRLPLPLVNELSLEPLCALQQAGGPEAARHEAAWKLSRNAEAVARFAARGAGRPGPRQFQAPLADPTAIPDEASVAPVGAVMRLVVRAMLEGDGNPPPAAAAAEVVAAAGGRRKEVAASLRYLCLRVGVPRDMSQPAARALRAHLNWAIDLLG